jgi:hypothetical protein
MRSGRPRNRRLVVSACGCGSAVSVPQPYGEPGPVPRESAQAMRDRRRLIVVSVANRPAARAAAGRPDSQAYPGHRPRGCRGDTNVLRHDLPGHAPPASISIVEGRAMRLRCPGRARTAAPAGTDHAVTLDAAAAFIGRLRTTAQARRRLGPRPSRSSDLSAVEPCRVHWMACTCIPLSELGGSKLHLSARCTSVLVSVYSSPGTTRGKSGGGVGKRHAGDGLRH